MENCNGQQWWWWGHNNYVQYPYPTAPRAPAPAPAPPAAIARPSPRDPRLRSKAGSSSAAADVQHQVYGYDGQCSNNSAPDYYATNPAYNMGCSYGGYYCPNYNEQQVAAGQFQNAPQSQQMWLSNQQSYVSHQQMTCSYSERTNCGGNLWGSSYDNASQPSVSRCRNNSKIANRQNSSTYKWRRHGLLGDSPSDRWYVPCAGSFHHDQSSTNTVSRSIGETGTLATKDLNVVKPRLKSRWSQPSTCSRRASSSHATAVDDVGELQSDQAEIDDFIQTEGAFKMRMSDLTVSKPRRSLHDAVMVRGRPSGDSVGTHRKCVQIKEPVVGSAVVDFGRSYTLLFKSLRTHVNAFLCDVIFSKSSVIANWSLNTPSNVSSSRPVFTLDIVPEFNAYCDIVLAVDSDSYFPNERRYSSSMVDHYVYKPNCSGERFESPVLVATPNTQMQELSESDDSVSQTFCCFFENSCDLQMYGRECVVPYQLSNADVLSANSCDFMVVEDREYVSSVLEVQEDNHGSSPASSGKSDDSHEDKGLKKVGFTNETPVNIKVDSSLLTSNMAGPLQNMVLLEPNGMGGTGADHYSHETSSNLTDELIVKLGNGSQSNVPSISHPHSGNVTILQDDRLPARRMVNALTGETGKADVVNCLEDKTPSNYRAPKKSESCELGPNKNTGNSFNSVRSPGKRQNKALVESNSKDVNSQMSNRSDQSVRVRRTLAESEANSKNYKSTAKRSDNTSGIKSSKFTRNCEVQPRLKRKKNATEDETINNVDNLKGNKPCEPVGTHEIVKDKERYQQESSKLMRSDSHDRSHQGKKHHKSLSRDLEKVHPIVLPRSSRGHPRVHSDENSEAAPNNDKKRTREVDKIVSSAGKKRDINNSTKEQNVENKSCGVSPSAAKPTPQTKQSYHQHQTSDVANKSNKGPDNSHGKVVKRSKHTSRCSRDRESSKDGKPSQEMSSRKRTRNVSEASKSSSKRRKSDRRAMSTTDTPTKSQDLSPEWTPSRHTGTCSNSSPATGVFTGTRSRTASPAASLKKLQQFFSSRYSTDSDDSFTDTFEDWYGTSRVSQWVKSSSFSEATSPIRMSPYPQRVRKQAACFNAVDSATPSTLCKRLKAISTSDKSGNTSTPSATADNSTVGSDGVRKKNSVSVISGASNKKRHGVSSQKPAGSKVNPTSLERALVGDPTTSVAHQETLNSQRTKTGSSCETAARVALRSSPSGPGENTITDTNKASSQSEIQRVLKSPLREAGLDDVEITSQSSTINCESSPGRISSCGGSSVIILSPPAPIKSNNSVKVSDTADDSFFSCMWEVILPDVKSPLEILSDLVIVAMKELDAYINNFNFIEKLQSQVMRDKEFKHLEELFLNRFKSLYERIEHTMFVLTPLLPEAQVHTILQKKLDMQNRMSLDTVSVLRELRGMHDVMTGRKSIKSSFGEKLVTKAKIAARLFNMQLYKQPDQDSASNKSSHQELHKPLYPLNRSALHVQTIRNQHHSIPSTPHSSLANNKANKGLNKCACSCAKSAVRMCSGCGKET